MKRLLLLMAGIGIAFSAQSQLNARLMQYPDVSDTHISFTYGDDIWIVSKEGGLANRLSSPLGVEGFSRFSPDGTQIAYSANYNGNLDVYVVNVNGGIPKRLTYHGMGDRVIDWTPDGKSILFASSRESGKQRFSQFYTIPVAGGPATKLVIPYGENASFSADGSKVAYTDKSRVNRNWKRYRGGTAPDVLIFNLATRKVQNITNNDANDEIPMWIGNSVYYMSDNGPNKRNNIWKYDIDAGTNTQITQSTDYDITFPSNGKSEIVYEQGGRIFLLDTNSGNSREVSIQVISDQKNLIPVNKNVESFLQAATISPDGKRVIAQARGELFNLPATEGFTTNITKTSGVAEREPEWSPDGKYLACWSDASGEYQLLLYDMVGNAAPRKVTNFSDGFNYSIFWSPDSKKIAYVDQSMDINWIDVASGVVTNADKGKTMFQGALDNFAVSWSPDSRYFAYARQDQNPASSAIFIYDTQAKRVHQMTSGFYSDASPSFSKDGKYLFYMSNRTFSPLYSDVDNTFVYPNTTGLAVGTLYADTPSLLAAKNDATEVKKEEKAEEESSSKKKSKKKPEPKSEPAAKPILFAGFEDRVEMLPVQPGNMNQVTAVDGKVLFIRFPNSGSGGGQSSLDYYDIEGREVKTIISGIGGYAVAANGSKLLVSQRGKLGVIGISPGQKLDKAVPTSDMVMEIVPKEEWKQIFQDVWRMERDFFYDPNMHGVDWNEMRTRYGQLVDQANSRGDVNIIIGDLIAELNASHTYNGGGDIQNSSQMNVGYLGADLSLENGAYRVKRIIKGAPWDVEARSALSKPGVNVKEGDYILAVNGASVDTSKPFYAAFQGLGGDVVELTVNSSPSSSGARKVVLTTMRSELRLRHLEWAHNFRKRVDEATGGRVGYIFVPSTGVDGQNELIRQFYGQMHKEGLIIDERFNNGGQIPDRFVELLDRDPLAFWAVRDGRDWAWPPSGNFGAKVMLINGFAGSGGDAFPDYFKKRGVGPLIGTRTWGGLIGISGAPGLIDNGGVTVPTFRMYDPDGEWFKEGYGVDPDIEVVEDFEKLSNGTDAQLEAGIEEVLKLINGNSQFKKPARPAVEKRN